MDTFKTNIYRSCRHMTFLTVITVQCLGSLSMLRSGNCQLQNEPTLSVAGTVGWEGVREGWEVRGNFHFNIIIIILYNNTLRISNSFHLSCHPYFLFIRAFCEKMNYLDQIFTSTVTELSTTSPAAILHKRT